MSKYIDAVGLKIKLGKRLSTDERRIMEIVKETIDSMPTIEVSEDCISREYLLSKVYDMDNDDLVVDLKDIENAPSVVPIAEQSCDTCKYRELYECGDCRFASKWERIEE